MVNSAEFVLVRQVNTMIDDDRVLAHRVTHSPCVRPDPVSALAVFLVTKTSRDNFYHQSYIYK